MSHSWNYFLNIVASHIGSSCWNWGSILLYSNSMNSCQLFILAIIISVQIIFIYGFWNLAVVIVTLLTSLISMNLVLQWHYYIISVIQLRYHWTVVFNHLNIVIRQWRWQGILQLFYLSLLLFWKPTFILSVFTYGDRSLTLSLIAFSPIKIATIRAVVNQVII